MKKKRRFGWLVIVMIGLVYGIFAKERPSGHSEQEPDTLTAEQEPEIPAAEQVQEVIYLGQINVYSISEDKYIRSYDNVGDLSELGNDEYFSFCMQVQYNGDAVYAWEEAYVTVDGGEPWYWTPGEMPSGGSLEFHIEHANMEKCVSEGTHTVAWHFNGEKVYQKQFVITRNMNWETVFQTPSDAEIQNHNENSTIRSPYLYGWYTIPKETRYTEYIIDFKADHLPKGTYCCLGNWTMDYSALEEQYESVRTEYEGVHAYAGFQNLYNGDKVGIMSFWDIYCKDAAGVEQKIRATRVYPQEADDNEEFTGEGSGAHCLVPYTWEENHWYRMHLKCRASQDTGNTIVEQWIFDLETGEYTLICSYDIGVKKAAFQGSIAVFLENFLVEYSGEVRSMEIRNAQYLDADTSQWCALTEIYMGSDSGLPKYEGSYNFGVLKDRFWMITSGVGGDWYHNGMGKEAATLVTE